MMTFENKEDELQAKLDCIMMMVNNLDKPRYNNNIWVKFIIDNIRSIINE